MSGTKKKSTRRKERGLNVRVVQEQKEKKTDSVRVNTRERKPSSRKKDIEPEIKIDAKKEEKVEEKAEEEFEWKVEEKEEKKVESKAKKKEEEKAEKKTEEKVEKKAEEKEEKKVEEKKEEEVEKKVEEKPEEPVEYFETLNLHTDTEKATSKVILRDVAKETPVIDSKIAKETPKPQPKTESVVTAIPETKPEPAKKVTAKEIKEQEIKKAVSMAAKLPQPSKKSTRRSRVPMNFGIARVVLAIACLSTAVFAIVYFINLNSSDISLRVAAMQSGIEAVYPSYIPRGYTLADVTSSSGKVTMKFKSDNGGYTLTEEPAEWNSDGLLSNFVRPTYGDDYTVVSEQGLTIYVGDRWGAWVNGGMIYKLTVDSGSLTKKQIKAIATSV